MQPVILEPTTGEEVTYQARRVLPGTAVSFVAGNVSGDYGGGIFAYYYSAPTITNAIVVGNSALEGGGLLAMARDDDAIWFSQFTMGVVRFVPAAQPGGVDEAEQGAGEKVPAQYHRGHRAQHHQRHGGADGDAQLGRQAAQMQSALLEIAADAPGGGGQQGGPQQGPYGGRPAPQAAPARSDAQQQAQQRGAEQAHPLQEERVEGNRIEQLVGAGGGGEGEDGGVGARHGAVTGSAPNAGADPAHALLGHLDGDEPAAGDGPLLPGAVVLAPAVVTHPLQQLEVLLHRLLQ